MSLYRKTLFILISGKAGVGKTTTKKLLHTLMENDGVSTYCDSFAVGVKQAARMLGWDNVKDARGRKLLQDVGRLGREYNENVWIDSLIGRYAVKCLLPADAVLIDDWRFPNEYYYIKEQKDSLICEIVRVRIEAPEREVLKGTPENDDISEHSLVTSPMESLQYTNTRIYNYSIFNTGTMEELSDKVKIVYENLKQLREIIKND